MSNIVYNTSLPLPIHNKNNYGYDQPTNKYIFELYINDSNEKCIKKIETKSHSKLIKFNEKFRYIDINTFKINISQVSNNNVIDYNLEGHINHELITCTKSNDNIFIEFTKNNNGFTLCSCSLKNNNIFLSPPNY